jgi:hypothetical protein
MTFAYAIGLWLGALLSAFVTSRILLWLVRNWCAGSIWLVLANVGSFILIVAISIFVRGQFEWAAVGTHIVAQAIWLCIDLWRDRTTRMSL